MLSEIHSIYRSPLLLQLNSTSVNPQHAAGTQLACGGHANEGRMDAI